MCLYSCAMVKKWSMYTYETIFYAYYTYKTTISLWDLTGPTFESRTAQSSCCLGAQCAQGLRG